MKQRSMDEKAFGTFTRSFEWASTTLAPKCAEVALPAPFEQWLTGLESQAPAKEPRKRPAVHVMPLRARLLYYALACRSLLLVATQADAIESLPWLLPEQRLSFQWLDDLARLLPVCPLTAEAKRWLDGQHTQSLADPLRSLYEELLPGSLRQQMGEFYTPPWLADWIVTQVWQQGVRWLDPSVGGGAFALALARCAKQMGSREVQFVGIDSNPWAVLAAAASAAVANAWLKGGPDRGFTIPIVHLDVARSPAPAALLHRFDRIVGNPPWVLWDRIAADDRRDSMEQWRDYGLLAETGMASILGGGKKDLAMLLTYIAADRYLKIGGELAFVITQSVFKSAGAARGFRRWQLPDGTPLGIRRVDDLGDLRVFETASAKCATLILQKGTETRYPVPYYCWPKEQSAPPIEHLASPADDHDPLSAWRHSDSRSLAQIERVLGPCDYHAHLGVNTGGANGIYWLERIAVRPDGRWTMRNLTERSKLPIPAIEVDLEPDHLYPLVIGKDVRAWSAIPSAWLLLVQDPLRRRGIDPDRLKQTSPGALDYLAAFESRLRSRAAFRRYFQRPAGEDFVDIGPFYSMFDVGDYSLSPIKVVWNRMGHRLAAAVVTQLEGKPIQPQETHGMFAVERLAEAHYLSALLNSRWAQQALESMGQRGGKSFATPRSIHRLRLAKYCESIDTHRSLAELGRYAAEQAQSNGQPEPALIEQVDAEAARHWRIETPFRRVTA